MRAIRSLLGLGETADADSDSATVRRIADELDRLSEDEARYVASFAYVLARVAGADLHVSDEEVREMERIVGRVADLSPAQTTLVVQIAKHQALHFGGTEDYLVTRQFKDLSSRNQRIGLVRCLFALAAAHDGVSHEEDQAITQIGVELGLTGPDVAGVRASVREHLSVLKPS